MKVYGIAVPYINTSLSIAYNKQLEVIVLDYDDISKRYSYVHMLVYKKGMWVQSLKQDKRFEMYYTNNTKVYSDLSQCLKYNHGILLCDSLELAQAAKLLLVRRVQEDFEKAVEKLRNKINKNIPDTNDAIQKMKEINPEIFI